MKKKRNSEGKRLQHFELSNKNWAVRWVLIAILLIIAGVALGSGLNSALQTPAGWHTVEGNSTALNCGEQFVLRYEYGAGENSSTAESKALELLYGKTIENAWKLFFNEAGSSELGGILKINQNPNKEIEIDSGLYQALEQVVNSGNRALYLAPVYAAYDQVFFSENDSAAKEVDPGQNEELKAYVQTLADYAKDSNAIGLVLLGDNKVMLNVSQEYMAFSQENEVRYLVDFGWLRNAFVADYIANELTNNGFTNGFIASVDGFTRNLDNRANAYSLNVFNKNQNSVDLAAVMEYSAPKSLAFLRGYPMYDQENYRYYSFANGRIVTAMIDPEDGQSKVATDNLVSYSENLGCGELALSVMPVYVADTFSEQTLNELTNEGIYSVWFNDKQLMYNQQGLKLTVNDPYYTK
jgi:hypothetical protein